MPALNSSALIFQLMQAAQQRQLQEQTRTRDVGMYFDQRAQQEAAQREADAKAAKAEAAALTQARAATGEEAPVYTTRNEQAGAEMGRLEAALAARAAQNQQAQLVQKAEQERALQLLKEGGESERLAAKLAMDQLIAQGRNTAGLQEAKILAGSRAQISGSMGADDALRAYTGLVQQAGELTQNARARRLKGTPGAERANAFREAFGVYSQARALAQAYGLPQSPELERYMQELHSLYGSEAGQPSPPGPVPPQPQAPLTTEGSEAQQRIDARRRALGIPPRQ